jgi:molybdate transport system substrate-binding protein
MRPLEIASAGAARGLLDALQGSPATPLDVVLRTTYAPAGRVAARVRTDERLDVVILTADLLKVLAHESRVDGATVRSIGAAQTGLAVRTGETSPRVRDAETLRSTLLACDSIFCPDTQVATSGIHFASVLGRLGIAESVADRILELPNGTAAMHALAQSGGVAIGCTMIPEIIDSPGVTLIGALPHEFDLVSEYVAAVGSSAGDPAAAAQFVELLTSPETADLRAKAGFATAVLP